MKLSTKVVALYVPVALLAGLTACVDVVGDDEPDPTTDVEERYDVDVDINVVCECTPVYPSCHPGQHGTAGQTCRLSNGAGSCGSNYPPTCEGRTILD